MNPIRFAPVLLSILVLVLAGCSSDGGGDNPAGSTGPTEAELDDAMEKLGLVSDYYGRGMALAAVMDTAAAIDSLARILGADPEVEWAEAIGTGVNLRWKSGLLGMVTLRLRTGGGEGKRGGLRPAGDAPSLRRPGSGVLPKREGGYRMPRHRKTLFLSGCYSEFRGEEDRLIDTAAVAFPRIGFEPFTVYKDEEVTLSRLKGVGSGGYGFVRLSSHGAPWPSENDIQEVFFVTGETPTRESFVEHWEDIEKQSALIAGFPGGKRYYVSSVFFAEHNDFGDGLPFVALSFCFGYRGYWPGDMMTHAKAGAVCGWDWEVTNGMDGAYTRAMIEMMCDTTQTYPITAARAHATGDTSYTETDGRVISFHCMSVADSFGLWEPLRVDSIYPNAALAGDTIEVTGVGFGEEPGRVLFDETAGTVLSWHNGIIRVTVPSGLEPSEMYLTVALGGRRSNPRPFTLIDDELVRLLWSRSWIEIHFYAYHLYDGEQAGESAFNRILQPLDWTGLTFAHEERRLDEYSPDYFFFSGSIARDGRKVSLVYTYADTVESASGRTEIYKRMRITDLPYDPTTSSQFDMDGAEIQNHVSELVYKERRWDAGGASTYESDYRETLWEYGYRSLSCTFGGLQGGK